MKTFVIRTSETIHKFYEVEADSLEDAEKMTFDKRDKVSQVKTVQLVDQIFEKISWNAL